MNRRAVVAALIVAAVSTGIRAEDPPVIQAVLSTEPLFSYEDAPATPDADDPAIWLHPRDPAQSLVIGTAKDAGLVVYNLAGQLIQSIRPQRAPQILSDDPPTPAAPNLSPDAPCVDSDSGETFGRFNNVDIAYGVRVRTRGRPAATDVAIVSDRGCDRIRFYKIDPSSTSGPLIDITAPDVPRVFPTRYDQPSPLQTPGGIEGWRANPVDDQNTVYGLTVAQGAQPDVFVSQRERGLVRQLRVDSRSDGTLTYSLTRTFLFDTTFELRDESRLTYAWTPCREAPEEEPQSEGLVYDAANQTLFVAFETIGLYRLTIQPSSPTFITVTLSQLIEPVKSFGRAYRARPDDDEFECEYDAGPPDDGDIVAEGSTANAGDFIDADLEGLALIANMAGRTLLLASSQGDSSFHFYNVARASVQHVGEFFVEGVGDTDGVHYLNVPLGATYPFGLLVVQNGEAPEPDDTDPVNGYEFDGATQFKYVNFRDVLKALFE
jgi:3-phytase